MSVDSTHQLYDRRLGAWQLLRDVLAGEDAVKAAGTSYLPMLEGQSRADYGAYRQRALFFDATARTIEGLTGAIHRKEPVIDAPPGAALPLDNVTGRNTPFAAFAKAVTREVIALGLHGVLVDVAPGANAPYLVGYRAEAIRNFRVALVEGRPRLALVVLGEELARPKAEDFFETALVPRRRVLQLIDGRYTVSVWRRREDAGDTGAAGEWVMVGDPIQPTRRGAFLDFIPFQFIGPASLEPGYPRPPLLGLANVNLSHYRTSADLEHGAHFTALPTIWIAGGLVGENGQEMKVGSAVAWQLEEGAAAGMLEYRGQGLEALERRLERKEHHMAVLGARLLEDQKAAAEAAATVRLRHSGENSLLAGIADTVARGLTCALDWMHWWAGGERGEVRVRLNKDFIDAPMTAQAMTAMIRAWQQGAIGARALFHNLKQGERLPDGMSFDDWRADIAAAGARRSTIDSPGNESPGPEEMD